MMRSGAPYAQNHFRTVSPPPTPKSPLFTRQSESRVNALPWKERVHALDVAKVVSRSISEENDRFGFHDLVSLRDEDKLRELPSTAEEDSSTSKKVTLRSLSTRPEPPLPPPATPTPCPPLPERLAVSLPAVSVLRDRPNPHSPVGNAWSGEHYWKPQFATTPLRAESAPKAESPPAPTSFLSRSIYDEVLDEVAELASQVLEDKPGMTQLDAEIAAATHIITLLIDEIDKVHGRPVPEDIRIKLQESYGQQAEIMRGARMISLDNKATWLWTDESTNEDTNIMDRARDQYKKLGDKMRKSGDFTLNGTAMTLVWATKIYDDLLQKQRKRSASTASTSTSYRNDSSYHDETLTELGLSSDEEDYSACIKSITEELAESERRREARGRQRRRELEHLRDNSLGWPKRKVNIRINEDGEMEEVTDDEDDSPTRFRGKEDFKMRRKREEARVERTESEDVPQMPQMDPSLAQKSASMKRRDRAVFMNKLKGEDKTERKSRRSSLHLHSRQNPGSSILGNTDIPPVPSIGSSLSTRILAQSPTTPTFDQSPLVVAKSRESFAASKRKEAYSIGDRHHALQMSIQKMDSSPTTSTTAKGNSGNTPVLQSSPSIHRRSSLSSPTPLDAPTFPTPPSAQRQDSDSPSEQRLERKRLYDKSEDRRVKGRAPSMLDFEGMAEMIKSMGVDDDKKGSRSKKD
ncbi:hypothetical protein CC80DRAFT_592705 [Byssothecium circinans]|uniref:Uncharacterized protein n=1 Tax=Byssothecium circinans TaxID=147558 RepID=A0A6A5TYC4_9PLEO|nr:hypothetical protein CC80DRAFT_592705 [Byssothecium circinans]